MGECDGCEVLLSTWMMASKMSGKVRKCKLSLGEGKLKWGATAGASHPVEASISG